MFGMFITIVYNFISTFLNDIITDKFVFSPWQQRFVNLVFVLALENLFYCHPSPI